MDANTYPAIESAVNLRGPQFTTNRKSWEPLIEKFETLSKAATSEGNDKYLQRHQDRGQLLARDRIALILDSDSPFLELCPFAGLGQKDVPACGNLISGIGSICGRPCLVLSHIPTQNGGAWSTLTIPKQNRVTEIAIDNNLPIVALVQSVRTDRLVSKSFSTLSLTQEYFRRAYSFLGSLRSSMRELKSFATWPDEVNLGNNLARFIFVKGHAQVFLGGPPLVKMATGEVVDAESLGGAETHGKVTGLADQIAVDEFDAIRKAREWVSILPQKTSPSAVAVSSPAPPRYSAEDLLYLVDPDIRKPFDMAEVVLRLVDDSRISSFKPGFGSNLMTAFAQIYGHKVGIIANRIPVINGDEASKGAQFIRLCNQSNTPIIFLHNVTGFMVGTKAEHSAIIKKGAQMVSAVSCSKVPAISIILGASYGAGNYAMCGRGYKPRFLFAWPSARCSVMGPDQLAGVMQNIEANSAKSNGTEVNSEASHKRVQTLKDTVLRDSDCYRTSSTLLDDGVIDPRDTRDVLGMCLEVIGTEVEGADAHNILARL
ncbi:hypothetical protein MBLNU13_g03681t1 [Cladosporium sp. NU13]